MPHSPIFEVEAGNVTVDNNKGDVIISGAQFATDGYRVGGEAITTDTANTLIRVGDGYSRRRQLHRHYRQRYPVPAA